MNSLEVVGRGSREPQSLYRLPGHSYWCGCAGCKVVWLRLYLATARRALSYRGAQHDVCLASGLEQAEEA